ncbi:MAG: hypothetical protein M3Y71_18200 [Actinomycetota bacterium]|nr:hypothetical protein [Actinomycetota bacterium]
MCDDDECQSDEVQVAERKLGPYSHGPTARTAATPQAWPSPAAPSRRAVLGGVAAAVTAPVVLGSGPASAASPSQVSGERSFLAAMHMHGSFSEQQGSWQGQAWRMQQESVDLMFMTDHSHGQLATGMASDLTGAVITTRRAGNLLQQQASVTSGRARVLAESSGSSPASTTVLTDPGAKPNCLALRTSVMGQVLHHTFGSVAVDAGGVYEVRVGLSHHPATSGRPEGVYGLCFRFGPGLSRATLLEDRGLTGVVVGPLPRSGSTVDLDLAAACATAWPDLITEDNGLQWVSLTAVSPRAGIVVDLVVDTFAFGRETRTPVDVARVQSAMAARYSADYGVKIVPGAELGSRQHHSAFTTDQYFTSDEQLAYANPQAYTKANVGAIHAAGGVVSWNHPFGATVGTPLTGIAAARRRQAVYTTLAKHDVFDVDILEVGYGVRGNMSIEDHMGLWDTFSRHGRFLTANGVSDSHDSGVDRRRSNNEFVTGVWSSSLALGQILPALAAGRAFTRHVAHWMGGELDLVVDDVHLMGQVVIGSATSRQLTITATMLPRGSVVEVVAGRVDYQGMDPGTVVVATLPASLFGATGVTTTSFAVPGSCFVRLTVRDSAGVVIGIGNPVWLLTAPPAAGVPAGRVGPA